MMDPAVAEVVYRLDGKMDMALKHLEKLTEDHETRIRKLETKATWLSGAWSVVAFIGGAAMAYFKSKLS